jgi:hypothetical protein
LPILKISLLFWILLCLPPTHAKAAEAKRSWVYLYPSFNHLSVDQSSATLNPLEFSANTFKAIGLRAGNSWGLWEAEVGYFGYKFNINTTVSNVTNEASQGGYRFHLLAVRRVFSNWSDLKLHGHARFGVHGQSIPFISASETAPLLSAMNAKGLEASFVVTSYLRERTRLSATARWLPALLLSSGDSAVSNASSLANFEFSLGLQYLFTPNWSGGLVGTVNTSGWSGNLRDSDGTNPATQVRASQGTLQFLAGYQF